MNQNNEHIKTTPATVAAATPSQQAGETPARRDPWWWVERCVWTKAMLTRLASGESADRIWFRLWDKTYAPANLQSACDKVWRKGGSAGVDEQTTAHFGRHAEVELQRLHEQLRDGTYRPRLRSVLQWREDGVGKGIGATHQRWPNECCAPWAAEFDSGTRVDADNRSTTNPLTGEPDAGDPPVRFGGRGKVHPLSLPLSPFKSLPLLPAG